MWTHFAFAALLASWAGGLPSSARAGETNREGMDLAIELMAGVPQLLGAQATYMHLESFVFGAGFGTFPINSLVSQYVTLSPVPMSLGTSDTYNIYPSVYVTLQTFNGFLKFFPSKRIFYIELTYTPWAFRVSVTGNMKNETSGTMSYGVLTGSLNVQQSFAGLGIGWQWMAPFGLFFDLGIGANYAFAPTYSSSVSGSISSLFPLLPEADAAFTSAKTQMTTQLDSIMSQYSGTIKVIPMLHMSLGWAFDLF